LHRKLESDLASLFFACAATFFLFMVS